MSTVSVVIPCYNAAPYISRSICSVQEQTIQVQEIVCVDDGSSDNTLAVIENLGRASQCKLEIISQKHAGSAVARNAGLNIATGDFIQFLDADDVLLPGKLEHQLNLFINSRTSSDIVAGTFLNIPLHDLPGFIGPKFQDPWVSLMTSGLGVTSANLWRRQSILDIGGWNAAQKASQEYELMFRLMQKNSNVLLSHLPLTEKYQVSNSIQSIGESSERRKNAILCFIELRRSISEYLNSQGCLSDKIRNEYLNIMHVKLKSFSVHDKELALEIHRQEIPPGYRLPTSDGQGVLALDDLLFSLEQEFNERH